MQTHAEKMMNKYIPEASLQQYVTLNIDKDQFELRKRDGRMIFAQSFYDCVRDHFRFMRKCAISLHEGYIIYDANKIKK